MDPEDKLTTTPDGVGEEPDYGYSAKDRQAVADRMADRYLDSWFGSGL